jgi:hypothetical protein
MKPLFLIDLMKTLLYLGFEGNKCDDIFFSTLATPLCFNLQTWLLLGGKIRINGYIIILTFHALRIIQIHSLLISCMASLCTMERSWTYLHVCCFLDHIPKYEELLEDVLIKWLYKTLDGDVRVWFRSLRKGSISSLEDFVEKFRLYWDLDYEEGTVPFAPLYEETLEGITNEDHSKEDSTRLA